MFLAYYKLNTIVTLDLSHPSHGGALRIWVRISKIKNSSSHLATASKIQAWHDRPLLLMRCSKKFSYQGSVDFRSSSINNTRSLGFFFNKIEVFGTTLSWGSPHFLKQYFFLSKEAKNCFALGNFQTAPYYLSRGLIGCGRQWIIRRQGESVTFLEIPIWLVRGLKIVPPWGNTMRLIYSHTTY